MENVKGSREGSTGEACPKEGNKNRLTRPLAMLKLPEVIRRTGRGRSGIYSDMAAGTFPAPVKLGVRAVAWAEHEIEEWIEARIRARGPAERAT